MELGRFSSVELMTVTVSSGCVYRLQLPDSRPGTRSGLTAVTS
jgi:hypothetical protein